MSQASADPLDTLLTEEYPNYTGQLRHRKSSSGRDAKTTDPESVLPDAIAEKLPHDLYTHQEEGLSHLFNGDNLCVSTSTSSGKTLIYALYIAALRRENDSSKALLIYPTKALSRDQEHALNDLYSTLGMDISVRVYDGDTPSSRRKHIRNNADVIITNFSGVNTYLNLHSLWDQFYSDVDTVVIDESHSYTGIHGMHVAWTLRRLRRVLDHYGSDPQFIMTSATIGNPREHSKRLTGVDVEVVDTDGSPEGRKDIIFWRPPYQEQDDSGEIVQRPADQEASEILAHLTKHDKQTLMFTRSRKQTELNAQRARAAAKDHPLSGNVGIESYNAGHGKETRRAVENRLKSQDVDGVVTTNALELGIDIGSVDATLLSGYPGTRQSFWQQLGRAGRGTADALGIFVAKHDSIDQHILNNPDYLLDDDNIEDAVLDLSNNFVFAKHLLCAAQEIPLTHDDAQWFDPYRLERAITMWKDAGLMIGTLDQGVQYNGPRRPQQDISMYATDDTQLDIRCVDEDIDMEPIDKQRAYRDFHEGAVVIHKGEQYEVVELNDEAQNPYVKIKPVSVDYYTQILRETSIKDLTTKEKRELADGIEIHWGTGTVNIHYDGYKKIDLTSNKAGDRIHSTDVPPLELDTQLLWVEIDDSIIQHLKDGYKDTTRCSETDIALGGIHALEHAIITLAPLELRMDKQDLGGLSQLSHPELQGKGGLFIYDAVSGGLGFSRAIYNSIDDIVEQATSMIDTCECGDDHGCPACVMEDNCGDENEPLYTPAALDLAKMIHNSQ